MSTKPIPPTEPRPGGPIPPDEPTARGIAVAAAAGRPSADDNAVQGQRAAGDVPVTPADVAAALKGAELFVTEGTRQELIAGGRAYDYATGRELTIDRPDDAGPDVPGTVRFKTEKEIAKNPPPGQVATGDVASLNPS